MLRPALTSCYGDLIEAVLLDNATFRNDNRRQSRTMTALRRLAQRLPDKLSGLSTGQVLGFQCSVKPC